MLVLVWDIYDREIFINGNYLEFVWEYKCIK